jgi:hypothetical protein
VEERIFRKRGDQRYSLELMPARISLEVDRLRRSSHELWGEVSVLVDPSLIPSAKHIDGSLSIGDLNFSSPNARNARAKILAERSGVDQLDWIGFVEEFCVKVINAERVGSPDINLRDVPKPQPDRMFVVDGVEIPLRHPTILFGDGGTAKSYLCLYWAGKMIQAGHVVLYLDWEFTAEEHRERLEYLFGPQFPAVLYLPCRRPFYQEADRIRRIISNRKVTYIVCDSVGLGCGGDPNSSEAATSYFQTLRALGDLGSLHIAHVAKGFAGKSDDTKPIGSAFWHNMARVTLNVKGEELPNGDLALALHPRKRNLKGKGKLVAYRVSFGDERTTITTTDVKDHVLLAEGLPVADRIADYVRENGSKTRKELADALDVDYATMQRVIHREIKRGNLVRLEAASRGKERIGLPPSQRPPDGTAEF